MIQIMKRLNGSTTTPAYYVFDYLENNIKEAKATDNDKNYGEYYNDNSLNSSSCIKNVHPRWDENTNNYGTDNFGLSALPAGEASGEMGWPGMNGIWWTYSTDESAGESPVIIIDVNSGTVEISTDYGLKSLGYSVRCIKDK